MRKGITIVLMLNLIFAYNSYSQYGTLKGRVYDSYTGEPIEFASVVIINNDKNFGNTYSDEKGKYVIKPIPPGKYTVKSQYMGYKLKEIENIKINANEITYLDVKLKCDGTELFCHKIFTKFIEKNDSTTDYKKNIVCEFRKSEVQNYKIKIIKPDSLIMGVTYNLPSPFFEIISYVPCAFYYKDREECAYYKNPIVTQGDVVFHEITSDSINLSLQFLNPENTSWSLELSDVNLAKISFKKGEKALMDVSVNSGILRNMYPKEKDYDKHRVIKTKGGYLWVEQMPEFPGGEKSLNEFIKQSTDSVKVDKINEDRLWEIYVQVLIKADGSVENMTNEYYLKGVTDFKINKFISLMPKWKPGFHNGVAVPVYLMIPIKFY